MRTLKKKFQSNFDDVRYKVCIVTSHVLTVPDETRERCIFPILPVNVTWSYSRTVNAAYNVYCKTVITTCLKQSVKQLFQRVVKKSINIVKQSLEYTEKGQNSPYMSRYCKHS